MICSSDLYSFQTQRFSRSRRTASGRQDRTGMRSSERCTGQVEPRRRRWAETGSGILSSLWAVKHDPGGEIAAKRLETMIGAGRRKERVARSERNARAVAGESAVAAGDDVDLVLLVRGLRIAAPWCIVAQHHRPV